MTTTTRAAPRNRCRRILRWLGRPFRGYEILDPADCEHTSFPIPVGRHFYCPACWEIFVEDEDRQIITLDEAFRRADEALRRTCD